MKISAGIGSVDDLREMAAAGADSVYFGYVPPEWYRRFGEGTALNRREALSYNVQIGSRAELLILRDLCRILRIPARVVFNAPQYPKAALPHVLSVVREAAEAGFRDIIAADRPLIRRLAAGGDGVPSGLRLYVSGEYGELNYHAVRELAAFGAAGIIFPRQTAIAEMAALTAAFPSLEYEAFVLNEKCHFTGAYCSSLHTDVLGALCRLPCRLAAGTEGKAELPGHDPGPERAEGEAGISPGSGGCGLCALPALRSAGITSLKVVSRGCDRETAAASVRCLRTALDLLAETPSPEAYRESLFGTLFPEGCGGDCYYDETRQGDCLRR